MICTKPWCPYINYNHMEKTMMSLYTDIMIRTQLWCPYKALFCTEGIIWIVAVLFITNSNTKHISTTEYSNCSYVHWKIGNVSLPLWFTIYHHICYSIVYTYIITHMCSTIVFNKWPWKYDIRFNICTVSCYLEKNMFSSNEWFCISLFVSWTMRFYHNLVCFAGHDFALAVVKCVIITKGQFIPVK